MKQREKYFSKLPKQLKELLLEGFRKISRWDTAFMDIKKMVDRPNTYRWKPNKQLRVLYTKVWNNIIILKIWPRGDIYDD